MNTYNFMVNKKIINNTKSRYKPIYKKFIKLRKNVQNRSKVFGFKRKKWSKLIAYLKKRNYRRKRHFLAFDQQKHVFFRFTKIYKKTFFNNLLTKQRFKLFYGNLRVRYIRNLLYKKKKKLTILEFIDLMERRLDVLLYRSHFALSLRGARQMIRHKKILVNDKHVTIYSCRLKQGDCITVDPKSFKKIKENVAISNLWPIPPKYLLINYKILKVIFLGEIRYVDLSTLYPFWMDFNLLIRCFKY